MVLFKALTSIRIWINLQDSSYVASNYKKIDKTAYWLDCVYYSSGSKLCFLTCFSYFSRSFLILVFSRNHYSLITLRLSWLHGNLISPPVSCAFGTPSWYVIHAPPYFWHRMRGFLEEDAFCLLPKVSGANILWVNMNETFLTHKNPWTDTFSCDISPAKLHSTARVWNPQGIS